MKSVSTVIFAIVMSVSMTIPGVAASSDATPTADVAGECKCSIQVDVVDQSECTNCKVEGGCPTKYCSVLVDENGQSRQKKVSCEWTPEMEKCAECEVPRGWIVAIACPDEAEKNTCEDFECTIAKIGYNGPLVPGPEVRVRDCAAK